MTATDSVEAEGRIRPMVPADVAAVAALEAACFGERAWTLDQWRQEAASDPVRYYAVVTGEREQLRGYGGLLFAGSAADVLTLAVDPAARGRGLGARLLKHLLDVAGQRLAADVFLEVDEANTAALALYRSHGFVPQARRRHYYGPDQHALTMRRQLRPPWGAQPIQEAAR